MLSAALTAPFIIMKVPKKMLFIVSGSIASLSQAASKISWQVMKVFEKLQLCFMFLVVAMFNHLSKTLPEHEKIYLHDNLSWIPMVAAILVVICSGCLNQRHKKYTYHLLSRQIRSCNKISFTTCALCATTFLYVSLMD